MVIDNARTSRNGKIETIKFYFKTLIMYYSKIIT